MSASGKVRLDLNSPTFQRQLFSLEKDQQHAVLLTLRKLAEMSWLQVYRDSGLHWEVVQSQIGSGQEKLYSIRMGKAFRAICYRENDWLRLVSVHPDHDSAYR